MTIHLVADLYVKYYKKYYQIAYFIKGESNHFEKICVWCWNYMSDINIWHKGLHVIY